MYIIEHKCEEKMWTMSIFYFENILLNEKCTKVIYNCINKNNIIPNRIYKWNDKLSPHGLKSICIQEVFKFYFKITMDCSV